MIAPISDSTHPALCLDQDRPCSTTVPIPVAIFYTEVVEAHWRETTVGPHGEVVLEGLPFQPGQPVEVLVVSKAGPSAASDSQSLQNSVLEFHDPLEPVATEDWDILK